MLSLTGLRHVYPNGTRALEDVSLEIPPGMFGLLGPNGAGKSSLMRCLATLQVPSAGSIVFDGIDVLREPATLRATLGYLPQDFGVYPRVSAYDLLDHLAVLKGIARKGERKASVESLLVQVNLWNERHKAVAGFSGGMRQRFGIAQALLGSPRLVIVDEPTAGLDPEERNRFNDLLTKIADSVVVILSTHLVEDVADLCPRMAILVQGRVVCQGAPPDLLHDLEGRVWSRALDEGDDVASAKERWNVTSSRLRAGRSHVRVVATERPDEGFEARPPSLEDVYFATLREGRAVAADTNGAT
ncbi:MAG: ABC transporter ATP-binding protein [Proteobacteria bacterium]|nr:MAG: ABC transporter ATP-binding protein [Pseudomonadota bacterium]